MKFYILILVVLLNLDASQLQSEESPKSSDYIFHTKAYDFLELHGLMGFSIARLPAIIVEEEISFSPMLYAYFRFGLPLNISLNIQLNSNYISNQALAGLKWTFYDTDLSLAIGANYSLWYGQLKTDGINLESWGTMISPNISAGLDFKKFLISAEIEAQYSWFYTYSEDEYLGTVKKPAAGFAFKIALEQPLWNNNWVSLAIKLNYAKFYYQSWLTFTTINEYLLYPEFIFGFVL